MKPYKNRYVFKVIQLDQKHDLGLCFGLAPNPFGFTFESTDNVKLNKQITILLDGIENDSEASSMLREYIRGELWE